jgi:predicted translin family RNA/ssDNA-binding protein
MFKGIRRAQRIIDEAKWREETVALRAKYERESPESQMRIIRTHIAAQAGQISSILTEVSMLRALLTQHGKDVRADHEHLSQQLEQLRPACEPELAGGNHPAVPQ